VIPGIALCGGCFKLRDLRFVKKRRENEALTLFMAEDVKTVLQTASRGISGFLDAAENLGDKSEGASVADGAVGRVGCFAVRRFEGYGGLCFHVWQRSRAALSRLLRVC
jgi:hypothetical protein